ncbi:MAG TPA: hypothetical protein VFP86_09105 [bacterium]|nr:hypothetical protein [bacterium]
MAVDLIVKNGTIVTPLSSLRGHILMKNGERSGTPQGRLLRPCR